MTIAAQKHHSDKKPDGRDLAALQRYADFIDESVRRLLIAKDRTPA